MPFGVSGLDVMLVSREVLGEEVACLCRGDVACEFVVMPLQA